jgi:hypothetical protein
LMAERPHLPPPLYGLANDLGPEKAARTCHEQPSLTHSGCQSRAEL